MMAQPPPWAIYEALRVASGSPCRSRRGVVVYDETRSWGCGHNGPPPPFTCPGREVCTGTCGKRCVHAEMRALRGFWPISNRLELVHVELSSDGGVVACGGPSCWQCSREILDVGFIAGVWLYELPTVAEANAADVFRSDDPRHAELARWRHYTAEEFHRSTLERCGMVP